MSNGIEQLKASLPSLNNAELAKTYGLIGGYSRIMGNLEQSKHYLELAVAAYQNMGDAVGAFINELRLAHTLQWAGNYQQADALFLRLISGAEAYAQLNPYLDFAYQHYGKSLFDQKDYAEALAFFHKALTLRLLKSNYELTASTKQAIHLCTQKLNLTTSEARMNDKQNISDYAWPSS